MNFGYVPMPPPSPSKKNGNSKVSPLIHSNVAHSMATTAFDEEPMPDRSFIAEWGIFDDVKRTFYGVEDDQQEPEMLLPLSYL